MKNKAWSGRFTATQSREFLEYSASIGFDKLLARYDIVQSLAHAAALKKAGILKPAEFVKITKALRSIQNEVRKGTFKYRIEDEDIHMNIERRLREKTGALAGKLHAGRSRNDQIATDLRLFTREKINEILELLRQLRKTLVVQAKKNINTIMPGYTHLQQAQPVRAAHWFLAYQEMFSRDTERFNDALKRTDVSPHGSGALAGVNFDIDRNLTAGLMGFKKISRNSLDAVSDRDFALEFCFAVSLLFSHLSRLADELIIFASKEFSTIILPDELCTGSSIMPQKKNPDLPELFRAKAGRTTGNLMNLLMIFKGLPLAYNKDLQEDKPPLFDSAHQALSTLPLAVELVKNIKFNKAVLKKRLKEGFVTAVDLTDYLVLKDMPFRKAHRLVGKIVRRCEDKKITFADLALKDLKKHSDLFEKDVFKYIDPELSPDRKKGAGSTSRKAIMNNINRLQKELK